MNRIQFLLLIVFILLLNDESILAYNLNEGENVKLNASWIWQNDDGPSNTWLCFRKKVSLTEKPVTASTLIAAENKYWLYINGTLAIADGGMDLRPDFSNTYYDTLDIGQYLQAGENIIALLVWYKGGSNGYSQHMVNKGGVYFESFIPGKIPVTIKSDSDWKINLHPAFVRSPQQQQWNDFKWVEYPVIYDARNELDNWTTLSYDDTAWAYATVKGDAHAAPWNKLIHRTIPMLKNFEPVLFNKKQLPITVASDTVLIWDIGKNIQGYVHFRINSKAGDTIIIRMNEWYTENYVTRAGIQEYTTYQWQNTSGIPWSKHCVELSFKNVTSPVQILDLQFKPSGYNTEVLGKFECDNERLNILWEKCFNTSYVCMRDQFYDCPDRERGQWWGDVSEQILYSFYLYDSNSSLLAKKGFRELFDTQKEDGSLFTTAPGDRFHLPDQNMAAVISIKDYFMYTGDTSLVLELYPRIFDYVKKYLANTLNNDGVVILQDSVWNWIDWGDSLDVKTGSANTVVNALFIRLMESLELLAESIGNIEDVKYYQNLKYNVKTKFNNYFWDDINSAYAFHNLEDTLSSINDDRSNAWAVLAGVVDSTKKKSVLEILRKKLFASPYQERYIEEALFLMGNPEDALARMLNYYQPDIDSWSQTMWERMGNSSTNNHAWAASPCYLLGAYAAGIKPLTPAFSSYEILPMMGELKKISVSVPTAKGLVTVTDSLYSGGFSMKLISPAGTEAITGIPRMNNWNSITVNGIPVWENGKFLNNTDVEGIGTDPKYIKFRVKPGSWNFNAIIK